MRYIFLLHILLLLLNNHATCIEIEKTHCQKKERRDAYTRTGHTHTHINYRSEIKIISDSGFEMCARKGDGATAVTERVTEKESLAGTGNIHKIHCRDALIAT